MLERYDRALSIVGLGIVMLCCSAVYTRAQPGTTEVLRRMNVHNKALQSLKADVTLVKYDAALKVTDTTIGETTYIPEAKKQKLMMRLDWKTENGRAKQDSITIKNG